MKLFYIFAGLALLIAGAGGVVLMINGSELLKMILLEGPPVHVEHNGQEFQLPGRLLVIVAFLTPLACIVSGVLLLISGFSKKTAND